MNLMYFGGINMDISALFIYLFVQAMTPGPNNFMVFYIGANFGFKGVLKFASGSASGFFVKILLCGALNVVLASVVPGLVPYLKWFGAAYLVYLAVHVVLSGIKHVKAEKAALQLAAEAGGETLADNTQNEEQPIKGIGITYWGGIMLQVLNMKSWVLGLTVFSVYVMPYTTATGDIALCVLIAMFNMLLGTTTWATFGSSIKKIYGKYRIQFDIVMALALLYCAITALIH